MATEVAPRGKEVPKNHDHEKYRRDAAAPGTNVLAGGHVNPAVGALGVLVHDGLVLRVLGGQGAVRGLGSSARRVLLKSNESFVKK